MAIQLPSKHIPLYSIRLSIEDVKKIFERLSRHVGEQGDREIAQLVKPDDESNEDFNARVEKIKEDAFRITATINSADGTSLYGDSSDVFESPNIPDVISGIYLTNIVTYQEVAGNRPANSFELLLDFSKPPLLDGNNLVSSPTPNSSHLEIKGDRDSWVAAVSDAVLGVVNGRRTNRGWLHIAFMYDFGLFLFALPIGFYVCWLASSFIEEHLSARNGFFSVMAYVYLFFTVLWGYRIFWGYTKWAFPTVEISQVGSDVRNHRAFWYAIATGLVGNVIWLLIA